MINQSDFLKITDVVIDQLEGGYYHPQMLADGRVKDSRYASSGETMFGLDRKAGAGLAKYNGWAQFWGIIDNAGAKDKWKWNYNGGTLRPQLKQLAGTIMYNEYKNLYNKYLTQSAQAVVDTDPRLVFNFAYSAWNGSGWFKRFANALNMAIDAGEKNNDKLVALVVAQRTDSANSLIKQGGNKIAGFIDSLKSIVISTAQKLGPAVIILILLLAVGASYVIYHAIEVQKT